MTIGNLQEYCYKNRAFYIVDSPQTATTAGLITSGPAGSDAGSLTGQYSINSAYYYPWVQAPDPLMGNRQRAFPPCGFVAGIYATTDATRGVWKAPAGIDAEFDGKLGTANGSHRFAERQSQHSGNQLSARVQGVWRCRLGRSNVAGQRPSRVAMEVCTDQASRALHRIEPIRWHAVGGVRAE